MTPDPLFLAGLGVLALLTISPGADALLATLDNVFVRSLAFAVTLAVMGIACSRRTHTR